MKAVFIIMQFLFDCISVLLQTASKYMQFVASIYMFAGRMEKLRGGSGFGEGVSSSLRDWMKAALAVQVKSCTVSGSPWPLCWRPDPLIGVSSECFSINNATMIITGFSEKNIIQISFCKYSFCSNSRTT